MDRNSEACSIFGEIILIDIAGCSTGILSRDTFFGKDKKFADAGVKIGSKMKLYIFFLNKILSEPHSVIQK